METFIVKRDGTREAFSMEKIQRAIAKAFLSVGSFATQDVITNIPSRVSVTDGISVEEIQNQVEVALMAERYYTVAKAYMLYRQRHTEDREVRDKLQFLMEYCDASNAATGSKFDANANVENKNMATLIGELPKSNFIRPNRRMLTDRLKEMYGKELADKYIEMLNDHFIYKNDETSLANYCASITMYPWLIGGTISIGGQFESPDQPQVILRRLREYGFYRVEYAQRRLRHTRISDVYELFYRPGVRHRLFQTGGRGGRSLEETAHDRQGHHRLFRTDRLFDQPADRSAEFPGRVLERGLLRPLLFREPVRKFPLPPTAASPTGSRSAGCKSVS